MSEAFFTLYSGLDREGPGEAADVVWALEKLGLNGPLRVCDAGCGSGADTVTLAGNLPLARIDAVDAAASLVAQARERCAGLGKRVSVRQGDMAQLQGPYDLIWCAGALYFLGLSEGLVKWRGALASGGYVAFSEPVFLSDPPGEAVRHFWADYPSVTDLAGIETRVAAAGYRVLAQRLIVGAGWGAYYASLEQRIAQLRQRDVGAELAAVIDESAKEIAQWRAAPDQIAYALILTGPV